MELGTLLETWGLIEPNISKKRKFEYNSVLSYLKHKSPIGDFTRDSDPDFFETQPWKSVQRIVSTPPLDY